jgi:hypothetical protein
VNFWSSTESGSNAWRRNLNYGNSTVNRNDNTKANGFSVRCLKNWFLKKARSDHILGVVGPLSQRLPRPIYMRIEDLFQAYYDARKNKRNTVNALKFEYDYEQELFKLYREIKEKRYTLKRSICFINNYPVKREIFAADFRDRVVHHLIYNYIYHIFERIFIHDSYSCREGRGTLFGIKRLDKFIRSCSRNYSRDCYILKLDIAGYFMNMDKMLLYRKTESVLAGYKNSLQKINLELLLYLIRKVIFDDPTCGCYIKGNKNKWNGLPRDKSLFCSGKNKGLPIGNLTSQLFSNVYLNDFDHFMKYKLGCRYYGRYVDDFFAVSRDKEFLKKIKKKAEDYLREKCFLHIHKNKVYLQHFTKGVDFLGAYVKPYRIYIKNKIKGNFYKVIRNWNTRMSSPVSPSKGDKPVALGGRHKEEIRDFVYRANSYLGIMSHFQTKKLRSSALAGIDADSFNRFYIKNAQDKCLSLRNCFYEFY